MQADSLNIFLLLDLFCSAPTISLRTSPSHPTSSRGMTDLQGRPRSVDFQWEEQLLHCVQPSQLSTTTLPTHRAVTMIGMTISHSILERFINIQFLDNKIHPVYVCHSINSKKKNDTGMKPPPQSRHKTFLSPPKFPLFLLADIPLHHTQPLSIIDLSVSIIVPFPDCHINRMMEYGVFLCQPLLSIEHLGSIMSCESVICLFITE